MVCYVFLFTFIMSVIIQNLEKYFSEPELVDLPEQE